MDTNEQLIEANKRLRLLLIDAFEIIEGFDRSERGERIVKKGLEEIKRQKQLEIELQIPK